MQNSKAYKCLIEQINASDSRKLDGYNTNIMGEIYEWEREEAEEIIWKLFHENKDVDLAEFLPKLRKYDGIGALKEALGECTIPSDNSVILSQILYEYTGNDQYLDIIKENIDRDENKISNVARLSYCKPCDKTYKLLLDIYFKSNNKTIRSIAVTGILYNKGVIVEPHNLQEIMGKVDLKRKFVADDINERKRIITMFESGQLHEIPSVEGGS